MGLKRDCVQVTRAQAKLAEVYRERCTNAVQRYLDAVKAAGEPLADRPIRSASPLDLWRDASNYWLDFTQRSILFWDTLRQRGNNWLEHEKAGKPPLLDFDWEMVADARTFERPANYALVRITPPDGVETDPERRPFVIIDPRAGHGPGIGGFKQDSQVGVALKAGHPVYFVIFFPEPVPGQTLADVSRAEAEFLRIVGERHPKTRKPVVVGNCQGGWASMLVGALEPDLVGPIVINGAPMSYWAGNDGENPMRYAGGMLGGVWPALLASDLGAGTFDGAYLVENFEYSQSRQHLLRQVLQPLLEDRHRAGALPRIRALVGRLLPDGPAGDQVDRREPVRRQQPRGRRRRMVRGPRLRPAGDPNRRSSCSRRSATTSRRRSRPSTGSPISIRPRRPSRRTGRSSSA